MIIKLNPTGTHIHKGFLKVRLDLYPEPTDKTYALHYTDEVDADGNPTGNKKLNPCLCHFLTIDTSKSKTEIIQEIKTIFDTGTVGALDDALVLADSAQRVSQIMKSKLGTGNPVKGSLTKLVKDTNTLLSNVEVTV